MNVKDLSGNYELTIANQHFKMEITGEPSKPKIVMRSPLRKKEYDDDIISEMVREY